MENPDVDGRIILKWIFEKWDRDMDLIELAQNRNRWRVLGECGNKPTDSIKCEEFVEQLRAS